MKHQIKYALDVQTKTSVYERTVTQNDTIEFIITMLMGGEKMDLTNVTPSLAVKRLDGTVTVLEGTVDGNVITFNLGSSETAKPGRTQAVVQLYDDNGRVSSLPFSFFVSADFTAAGFTPSENERTLIEVVLQDGPGVIDRATDAASLAERVAAQNETHPRGIYDTETARDAAIPNPLHGDTATVANDSTGISTTYRYVDATVDDTVTKSGWIPTERLNNPSAIRQLNQQLAETVSDVAVLKDPLKTRRIFADFYPPTEGDGEEGDIWVVLVDEGNLIPITRADWEQGSIAGATGDSMDATHRIRTKQPFNVAGGKNYVLSFDRLYEGGIYVQTNTFEYTSSDAFIQSSGWQNTPFNFTTHGNTAKMKVIFKFTNDATILPDEISRIKPSVKVVE